MNILFLAKNKPFSEDVAELIKLNIKDAVIIFGTVNDPFPSQLLTKKFDYVISYISPWVIPEQVLENTRIAAINFHTGPPEYPGIGCTNFAIYNGEKEYGITVHYMKAKVDSGDIIAVKRFPIFENDTVYSLTQRCYAYIYTSFVELFPIVLSEKPLPRSRERWKRKPFTRRELDELCIITKDMSENEIKRRIRATSYPEMPGAYIELAGTRFYAPSNKENNN
ncbi:Methionyl-tRNA formyltransferase [uncultured archaeon]|nr:Methionyl-tRNA formyltransferase [uncultured archaeon]